MDSVLYISFVIASVGIIVFPGPNVLIIVSASLKYGRSRGLQTVAGTSLAMLIQLIIAATGTLWFTRALTQGLSVLKWIGILYLLFLAYQQLKHAAQGRHIDVQLSAGATFSKGFFVSLTNPKTIVFFSAFLPQFVSTADRYSWQIGILSITFLLLAIIMDSAYALLAAKVQMLLNRRGFSRVQSVFSGLLYLAASLWLFAYRRTS